ncbi:MAG TPA: cupredoxin family copper-binding protein [Solirubrobacterales bacterium]|nr:cupredoxin family copper-binding protein [Solirubrobacterales bacterium]
MQTHGFPLKTFLASILLVSAFGLAACGDNNSDTTVTTEEATPTTTTTETESTETEAGANAPAPSGDAVRSAKVDIAEFTYQPDPVTIEEGGKVIWINRDSAPHTATADDGSFDTGTLEEGKLKSETFKEPGTYAYHCQIHPNMHGTVEVVPSE